VPACPAGRVPVVRAARRPADALSVAGGTIVGMTWTTDTFPVSDGRYFLYGPELPTGWDEHALARIFHGNGVAAGCPDHLTVLCGTRHGVIRLGVGLRADAPAPPGPEWESAVEVSVHSSGELALYGPGGLAVPAAGNLAHAGPGWYRIRVQTRGRDRGRELLPSEPLRAVEEHLLLVWPGEPAADVVFRVGDATGVRHYDPRRPAPLPICPPSRAA